MRFWPVIIILSFCLSSFAQEIVFEEVRPSSEKESDLIDLGHLNGTLMLGHYRDKKTSEVVSDAFYSKEAQISSSFFYSFGVQLEGNRPHGYENFISYKSDLFNLKIGQQIVNWARIDFFSPLESINTLSLENFFIRETKYQKIGNPIFSFEYSIFKFFLSPWKRASFLPERNSQWSFFQNNSLLGIEKNNLLSMLRYESEPEKKRSLSYGLRINRDLGQSDFGISFVHGQQGLPTFELKGNLLIPVFPVIDTWSVDFSTSLSDYVFKGEFAYIQGTQITKKDFSKKEGESFNSALSLEGHPFESSVKFKMTLSHQFIDSAESVYEQKEEMTAHFELEKFFIGDRLMANIGILQTLNEKGTGILIHLKYNLNDNFQLGLKGIDLSGTGRGPIAFFSDNSSLYTYLEIDL